MNLKVAKKVEILQEQRVISGILKIVLRRGKTLFQTLTISWRCVRCSQEEGYFIQLRKVESGGERLPALAKMSRPVAWGHGVVTLQRAGSRQWASQCQLVGAQD